MMLKSFQFCILILLLNNLTCSKSVSKPKAEAIGILAKQALEAFRPYLSKCENIPVKKSGGKLVLMINVVINFCIDIFVYSMEM